MPTVPTPAPDRPAANHTGVTTHCLLDLCCYDGGAAAGYAEAGFRVVGVDVECRPDYPYEFVQADALEFMDRMLAGGTWEWLKLDDFAAIHASPPCQAHVQWNNLNAVKWGNRVEHPDLIAPIRDRLVASGKPYVIENVVGAPLVDPVMLCGSMFGLGVRRHRLFESNVRLAAPRHCAHTRQEIAVYGKLDGRRIWTRADGSEVRAACTIEQARAAMGIDWMEWESLKEAIPPAYTRWLGPQLVAAIEGRPLGQLELLL